MGEKKKFLTDEDRVDIQKESSKINTIASLATDLMWSEIDKLQLTEKQKIIATYFIIHAMKRAINEKFDEMGLEVVEGKI